MRADVQIPTIHCASSICNPCMRGQRQGVPKGGRRSWVELVNSRFSEKSCLSISSENYSGRYLMSTLGLHMHAYTSTCGPWTCRHLYTHIFTLCICTHAKMKTKKISLWDFSGLRMCFEKSSETVTKQCMECLVFFQWKILRSSNIFFLFMHCISAHC